MKQAQFVVKTNSAYHRASWPWVFGLLAVVCLGIAIRFAWLGYWMILPFALLDVLAVGIIFYLISYRSAYVEVIKMDHGERGEVEIQHIQPNKDNQWTFPAYWTQVKLEAPQHRWYPHRLLIGCKGQWIEIGRCLTQGERESLAKSLKKELALVNYGV